MNRKCQQHKNNDYEFLNLKPNTKAKDLLICSRCIHDSNGEIQFVDCLSLKEIQEANSQTILCQYPPLTDSQLNQKIWNISCSIDVEVTKIKDFYIKLANDFQNALKISCKKSKDQIDQLQQLRESFISKYEEIAQIDELKKLIQNAQNGSDSDALRSFIQKKINETTLNTNKIINEFKELQDYKRNFSPEQPEEKLSSIASSIEEISFFCKTLFQPSTTGGSILIQQNSRQRQLINQITINPSSNVGDSKDNLKIERINNSQIQITNIGDWGQSTFESVLNPKKNYALSIKAIIGDKKDCFPGFYFGIMPFQLRHQQELKERGICYNECSDNYGISRMIKGKQLHLGEKFETDLANYWRLEGERRFEVQINLEKRFIKIGSVPDYSMIAEMNGTRAIDLKEQYTFAFLCVGKDNKIVVEEIWEVDDFVVKDNSAKKSCCIFNLFKTKK